MNTMNASTKPKSRCARRSTAAALIVTILSGVPLIAAPTANAATSWAALVYHSGSNGVEHWRYWDYSGKAKIILEIQHDHPNAGYQLFHSGECAAVASFTTVLGETDFGTGVHQDLDAATTEALRNTYGNRYTLVDGFCQ